MMRRLAQYGHYILINICHHRVQFKLKELVALFNLQKLLSQNYEVSVHNLHIHLK